MSACVWFCLVMVCGGVVCVCVYYYFLIIFFKGSSMWQKTKYCSALILRLSNALALSQTQSCQNNLARIPKARPTAYLKTGTGSESG